MDFSTELQQALVSSLTAEWQQRSADTPEMGALGLENLLREVMQELGQLCLAALLEALAPRYPASEVPCACGKEAEYVFRREAKTLSVFGWVSYRRAYYLCPHCHQGQYPLDHRWGLRPGQVSVALSSLLAVEGIEAAFEEAARKIEKLLLLKVSENTVRKATQSFGELQQAREEQQQAESQDMDNLIARRREVTAPPERLYGALDGVQVPLDGEWRELKCGCWYEVDVQRQSQTIGETGALRANTISYYCDIAPASAFRDLVWTTGYQRLADRAKEIVFVADGAAWIWKLVSYHFPQAVQIVDWYHAAEYLTHIAEALFEESERQHDWLQEPRTHLWEGEIEQVIAICQAYADHPAAAPFVRQASTYYRNNAHRMDYGRLRRQGYQIGSGTVESACKQIGTQRLKRAGARWSEDGARRTAKARAAWLSEQWDDLEQRSLALAQAA